MRAFRILAATGALLAAGYGCGLLDSLTTFTIDTDWQRFTLDTAAIGLTVPAGSTIPAVPCTAASACTAASSAIKCSGTGYACSLTCGGNGNCAINATLEVGVPVDLSQKIKNSTQATALNKVSVQQLVMKTIENTLTFKTPTLELFVGPNTATTTTASGVVSFATIPPIEKGAMPEQQITVTEAGKAALTGFVKSYQTPFKLFVKASFSFASGDPIPAGKITIDEKAFFEVEPLK